MATKNSVQSDIKKRSQKIIKLLARYYGDAECALVHKSPFQLLIATILSAQCTDERVNKVTPVLFKKYPTAKDLGAAKVLDVEKIVHSTGLYKTKAKNIVACARAIDKEYGGIVPKTMQELNALAGVGRKTANVVLGTAFGIASGVVVDTHVGRISRRLGLAKGKNAETIAKELESLLDQKEWINYSHRLIHHGRKICKSRNPQCQVCFLQEICPKIGVTL